MISYTVNFTCLINFFKKYYSGRAIEEDLEG